MVIPSGRYLAAGHGGFGTAATPPPTPPQPSSQRSPTDAPPTSAFIRACVLVEFAILGYIVVLLREQLIPGRFLIDGFFIQRVAQGRATADVKYTNTADVYRFFGLADNPVGASLAGYTVAVVCVAVVAIKLRADPSNWTTTIVASVTLLLAAVYLGWYSKDVMVLVVVLTVLLAPPTRAGWILCVVSMIAYAWWFRDYWYLVVVGFAVLTRFPRVLSFWRTLGLAVAITVLASLALVAFLGMDPDSYRSAANESRAESDVGTLITPFVSVSGPAGGVLNNALTGLALVFPLPLAMRGGAYYLAIAVVVAALWAILLTSSKYASDTTSRRAIALVVAFVGVQAVFEPDYGSALRHLTPLLPLFLWVSWRTLRDRRSDVVHRRLGDARLDPGIATSAGTRPRIDDRTRAEPQRSPQSWPSGQ